MSKQHTLASPLSFHGRGLHTGVDVSMNILPADPDTGILFRRTDLEGAPEIPALADCVVDTSRGTTIGRDGVRVATVEHVMAALWASGVDNAVVEIDATETPIMDGSAREYAAAIAEAGLREQAAGRKYYDIDERVVYSDPGSGVEIEILPDNAFSVCVHVDYGSGVVGRQYATYREGDDFGGCIAPCRTFVFLHELEPLIERGLIKGGDLDNAIVVVESDVPDHEAERLSRLFNKQGVRIARGYLNNLDLRFDNEIARHKLLDLLGDFALLGMRIRGRVVATRPGHKANTELMKQLKKAIRKEGVKPRFRYNPAETPVYDINQIKGLLPHRPPFLLVDRIIAISDDAVAGIKNVTMNEPFFTGHFPDEPVMPGVLVVEAMAQCGGILALHSVPDPENYSTYFLKIDGVKFKRKIVPGDTIQFELSLVEPIRRGLVHMEARAFVAGQLATEAILMAQVAKTKQ